MHRHRRYLSSILVIGLVLLSISLNVHHASADEGDLIVVHVADEAALARIQAQYGATVVDAVEPLGIYVLAGSTGMMTTVSADSDVLLSAPEADMEGQPWLNGFGRGDIEAQPWLNGFGEAVEAMSDQYATRQIRLAQAQAISNGDQVVIAVLDTGIELAHPYFENKLVDGYDFVDEDDDPSEELDGIDNDDDGDIDEIAGHGTHVAGIVSIVAPHASIMPIRVFDSDGRGTYTDVIEGIVFAVENGADVINLSGSGIENSPFLEMGVQYAAENGVLVIAAGGANQLGYPAGYTEVVAVGASDAGDMMLDFAVFADPALYAPGASILSSYLDDEFAYWTGNSMATPFVTGLAALMSAVGDCDDGCITNLLNETATVIVDSDTTSHQRIDAYSAIVKAAITGRSTDGLQALYTFQEGSGETVFDVSGNGAPLDLTIEDSSATMWMPEGGLAILDDTVVASADPATKLINVTQASEEITIEAWVLPASERQRGPARIVTVSDDNTHRNMMIGQSNKRLQARLRTTDTNDNGKPNFKTPGQTFLAGLNHVIYSRDAAGVEQFYVNGELVAENVRTGSTSNWDATYRLLLANELSGEKTWRGIYHLVAVYDHAFDLDEVWQNYASGSGIALGPVLRPFDATATPADADERVSAQLQALYTFNTGAGEIVQDVSGVGSPLDLTIADSEAVTWLPDGGLSVHSATVISSALTTKITDATRNSSELTVEAWVTPAELTQSGPARIVTLSADSLNRSFTLGQVNKKVDFRLRTTDTNDNGKDSIRTEKVLTGEQVHIVYTRDALGEVHVYIDGTSVTTDTVYGTMTFWRDDMTFALANEVSGEKAWLGEYHLVAIYNRALSAQEVLHNFEAGIQ